MGHPPVILKGRVARPAEFVSHTVHHLAGDAWIFDYSVAVGEAPPLLLFLLWRENKVPCGLKQVFEMSDHGLLSTLVIPYWAGRQGPFGWSPTFTSGGTIRDVSNVTSTTPLGFPGKVAAETKVFGPLGLFSPFEHLGDPELYLQNLGSALGLSLINDSKLILKITGASSR
jgi:hypothetical protein